MLDLFAGSGAVGLEALSRGARWATFVEADPAAFRTLEKNVAKLRYANRSRLVRGTLPGALAGLPLPPGSGQPGEGGISGEAGGAQEMDRAGALGLGRYDLVSIMPPYGKGLIPPTLKALMQHPELLAGEGIVVAQFETGEPVPETPPDRLRQVEARVYGQTHLVFWRWGD
jgi:16S rRNA (guanine966-N2)-methyltransferase